MSQAPVHAQVNAVKTIHHGVISYGRGLSAAATSARSDLNRATAEFQRVAADSGRALNDAERRTAGAAAALAACRENCDPLSRALAEARVVEAEARRRDQHNRQALATLERTAAELLSSLGAIQAEAEQIVPAAGKRVLEYAEILQKYLAAGASR